MFLFSSFTALSTVTTHSKSISGGIGLGVSSILTDTQIETIGAFCDDENLGPEACASFVEENFGPNIFGGISARDLFAGLDCHYHAQPGPVIPGGGGDNPGSAPRRDGGGGGNPGIVPGGDNFDCY